MLVLLAIVYSGCSNAPARPLFIESLDLQAIVDQCSSEDITWGGRGTGSGGAGSAVEFTRTKHFHGDMRCTPEAAESFHQSLKQIFHDLIDASSGTYKDVIKAGSDEYVRSFRFDYQIGKEMGSVTARVDHSGERLSQEKYSFEVEIEVAVLGE